MLQALRKNEFHVLEAFVPVHFLLPVSFSILFLAPITARHVLAVGVSKTLVEPAEEALHGIDGSGSSIVPNLGCLGRVLAIQIAQEDRSAKQSPTDRASCSDGPRVACSSPLVGARPPTFAFSQNLQGGLGSGVSLCHELHPLAPGLSQSRISHTLASLFQDRAGRD